MKKRDVITLIVDKLRKHKEVLKAEFHDTENITKTKHFILDDVLP